MKHLEWIGEGTVINFCKDNFGEGYLIVRGSNGFGLVACDVFLLDYEMERYQTPVLMDFTLSDLNRLARSYDRKNHHFAYDF